MTPDQIQETFDTFFVVGKKFEDGKFIEKTLRDNNTYLDYNEEGYPAKCIVNDQSYLKFHEGFDTTVYFGIKTKYDKESGTYQMHPDSAERLAALFAG